jgi:Uma2 family endonuclease
MRAISLPEAKPAFEWVNGRPLQKVSPKRRHALAQGVFDTALGLWARERGCGMVGPEWRFQVKPPGQYRRPLVPDVAYLSYERMPYEEQLATEEPNIAPDVVVEVLSPGDRVRDVNEKVRVYLAAGTSVVFLVDPRRRIVRVIDGHGRRTLSEDGLLAHAALPGFTLAGRDLFEPPHPR